VAELGIYPQSHHGNVINITPAGIKQIKRVADSHFSSLDPHTASATFTLKKTSGPRSSGWVYASVSNLGFALIKRKIGGGKCELKGGHAQSASGESFYVAVQVAVSPNRPRLLVASTGQMLVGERRGKTRET